MSFVSAEINKQRARKKRGTLFYFYLNARTKKRRNYCFQSSAEFAFQQIVSAPLVLSYAFGFRITFLREGLGFGHVLITAEDGFALLSVSLFCREHKSGAHN
jgi:hypothetical protein